MNRKIFKNKKGNFIIYYIVSTILLLFLLNHFFFKDDGKISYSEFEKIGNENLIKSVEMTDTQIFITTKEIKDNPSKFLYTIAIPDEHLLEKLKEWNVSEYAYADTTKDPIFTFILNWILPMFFFIFIGSLFLKFIQKRMGGQSMNFGKEVGKIYAEKSIDVHFEDVAGQEEAKESLIEIVDFLHHPEKYGEIGAKLPKGALLVGPPGTGKTLLARAVAGEANVPFFSISGSEFVQMFVGAGAAKVRELFKQAQEKAPCIVFIDEIDAIGKSRNNSISSNDEREQTLNQLLTEMDGFDSSKGVVLLGATNRPEILDPALLRPGRFDRRVIVDRPDLIGREAILRVHAKGVSFEEDVNLKDIARSTPGAVGADLANMINEAALRAVKFGRKAVSQADIEEAVEIIIAGQQKKDRILSEYEKNAVAYHEVGHALVAQLSEHAEKVHKITIVPRTMGALGYTMQIPEEDRFLYTKEQLLDKIAVLLGGRSAEEIIFKKSSTGASNDIEKATEIARNMVTLYGMSEQFDMMALEKIENRYLGGQKAALVGETTLSLVDAEVKSIIQSAHKKALDLLNKNEGLLRFISEELLKKESLTGFQFEELIEIYNKKI